LLNAAPHRPLAGRCGVSERFQDCRRHIARFEANIPDDAATGRNL
jgi:hypothetical protein